MKDQKHVNNKKFVYNGKEIPGMEMPEYVKTELKAISEMKVLVNEENIDDRFKEEKKRIKEEIKKKKESIKAVLKYEVDKMNKKEEE